ncbi:hypothetical protein MASR2M78_24000 [Treponema sp.]
MKFWVSNESGKIKLRTKLDTIEISIKDYLFTLVDEIIENFPNSNIVTINKNIDDFLIDAKKLQAIGIIINEIISNSMKYAFIGKTNGLIVVSVSLNENHVCIKINDDGNGIPESIDFDTSTGFGLVLIKMLSIQIGGNIRMERGKGTTFYLEFKK